ncbi:hypothetical protein GSI_04032 [Ganoderma sinense ZZ0214-1]|uniref:Uncharacterized protein n=1 Tax=Ganoderma sinense ZZ0214-1 TaxID=1077348 RepID=A0A2G8SI25_9APHY|nr:hypothetical protein GSI_04032 [Ganoderma sinense ZZ0214-1]
MAFWGRLRQPGCSRDEYLSSASVGRGESTDAGTWNVACNEPWVGDWASYARVWSSYGPREELMPILLTTATPTDSPSQAVTPRVAMHAESESTPPIQDVGPEERSAIA